MKNEEQICRDCKHVIDENTKDVKQGSYYMHCSLRPLVLDINPITGAKGYRTKNGSRINLCQERFEGCDSNQNGDCPDFQRARNVLAEMCESCGEMIFGKKQRKEGGEE